VRDEADRTLLGREFQTCMACGIPIVQRLQAKF